ncbi:MULTISPECIES: PLP-dependent aminotransferase family protein [unclassified Roseitalea]|uniref:aminotransferase-like domain-containing protein n=1 Tax=unclassified Roseitalea TaxID=2639107 RepID=UPI00273EA1C1|nr:MULTISPECIES: PLP-dependent aminotransferase family protein [unclassified Roseitalea]
MTNWMPDIAGLDGPLYVRLADGIERDIVSGALPAGAKLPPQRNLAFDIGVTVGTVSRAYALARERGLVSGEVGRGTFVAGASRTPSGGEPHWYPKPAASETSGDDGTIRFDSSAAFSDRSYAQMSAILAEILREGDDRITDYVRGVRPDWQRAGARWIATGAGWEPEPERIVPVHGAHGGIMAVIAAMTSPGDLIAVEALTYGTVPRSAHLIGRRTASIAVDDKGIVPDSLDNLCAQQHPKLIFVMPAVHNPLTIAMPEDRRRAVVDIARRHNLWIVEDSLYGSLDRDPHTPFAALAPERTFHVSGLSKAAAAGVRGGWLACPPALTSRVSASHKLLTGGKSFVMTELAARMVLSGAAEALRADVRAETMSRLAIVRDVFAGCDFNSRDHVPFVWLRLPEPWLSGTFKAAALDENIRIDDEDEFKAGRGDTRLHGVRIAFASTIKDEAVLQQGVRTLRRLLDSGPAAYHSYN